MRFDKQRFGRQDVAIIEYVERWKCSIVIPTCEGSCGMYLAGELDSIAIELRLEPSRTFGPSLEFEFTRSTQKPKRGELSALNP